MSLLLFYKSRLDVEPLIYVENEEIPKKKRRKRKKGKECELEVTWEPGSPIKIRKKRCLEIMHLYMLMEED